VHISELAKERVKSVEDVVKVGDQVKFKVIGIDDKGKVRLSMKALLEDSEAPKE
jgi:polyribonucleotide nucleotidyltransferase